MRLPNLLATRRGRLAAFFFLYATEGIPLGFASTAVATQLRRDGVGVAEIGAFVGSFYLPWAFKWAFGPIVDVFGIERLGRRRGWILITQLMMAITLMSSAWLKLPEQLGLFTLILLVHNTFAATQDVAIDALAVNSLQDDERGIANGMMFAGAYIGMAVGGSGVLFLTGYTGFNATFFFVAGTILAVTAFIVLPMREAPSVRRTRDAAASATQRARAAGREMRDFAVASFRSFFGTRGAFAGLFFALLPAGAMCLGLGLQSSLAVEFGMSDDQVAWLQLWSAVLTATCCVAGGWLSDRIGRRRTLFVYIAAMSLPVLYLMSAASHYGWIMPVDIKAANRPLVPAALLTAFWIASLTYAAANGLMYGTRSAIFMDVTNPAVAATQFTAYMAMMNLAIAYSATWQGIAVEAFGYPTTMLIDALLGLACLLVLPLMKRVDLKGRFTDEGAPSRARGVAVVLALLCLAWLPLRSGMFSLGKAAPIGETLFTLVFIASALFLLAGAAVLGARTPRLARIGAWFAPLLLLMYARHGLDALVRWLGPGAGDTVRQVCEALLLIVPLVGSIILMLLARRDWSELREELAPA